MEIDRLPDHPPPEQIMAFQLNDEKFPPASAVFVYDQPCTILYVEDNADNMQLVERILTRHSGLTFLAASNGADGILLAREHRPDAILMDINMPSMGGVAVLEALLGDPETADIPVLALSSGAYPKQIEMGIKVGFFGYMTKPFRIDELEAALALAIAHSATKKRSQPSTSFLA